MKIFFLLITHLFRMWLRSDEKWTILLKDLFWRKISPLSCWLENYKCFVNFVCNNAKGRISKRVFQENKARQIFKKTNISPPPPRDTYA